MEWLKRVFRAREPDPPLGDPARIAEVEAVLDDLRPLLAADGGGVHLVRAGETAVVLRFVGACRSCSALGSTLAAGVEPELRRRLPWLLDIELEGH